MPEYASSSYSIRLKNSSNPSENMASCVLTESTISSLKTQLQNMAGIPSACIPLLRVTFVGRLPKILTSDSNPNVLIFVQPPDPKNFGIVFNPSNATTSPANLVMRSHCSIQAGLRNSWNISSIRRSLVAILFAEIGNLAGVSILKTIHPNFRQVQ